MNKISCKQNIDGLDIDELCEEDPQKFNEILDEIRSQLSIGCRVDKKKVVRIDYDTVDILNNEFNLLQTVTLASLIGKEIDDK